MAKFSALPGDHTKGFSDYADYIGFETINNRLIGLQNERLFDLMCKSYNLSDTSVPGFDGCKKPFQCDQDVTYQAKSYSMPFGQKMTLFCQVGPKCVDHLTNCDVSYKIYDDLNVWIKFKTADMPIQEILNYDRELHRKLDAVEVKNYPWTNDKSIREMGD